LLHLTCFVIYTAVFFYIIIKNPYSIVNWVLALLFLCFALWSACNFVLYNTKTILEDAREVIKVQSIGWASFITYYFLFILFLAGRKKLLENVFTYFVVFCVPMLFIYNTFSGRMLECCRQVPYGLTAAWKATPWTYAYYGYYTAMFLFGTYILLDFRNRTVIKTEKKMADILFLSAVTVFALGTAISVIMKNSGVYLPLDANVTFLVFVAGLIYCAEKYELLSLTGVKIAGKALNSISEGIILTSAEGEMLSANNAAFSILGCHEGVVTPCMERLLKKLAETREEVAEFEMEIMTPSGLKKVIEVSERQMREKGKLAGSVCVIRDITAEKAAADVLRHKVEELKRSNEELENFAYVASHDLKEPLRMIASYVQLLEKNARPGSGPSEMEYIGFASEGALRMDKLISDLLEYSRVNTQGREFEDTDMGVVIKRVVEILKFKAEDKKAKIDINCVFPVLRVDPVQIQQLLQNLIENAIKFSAVREPEVSVSCARKDGYYEFCVKDNGIGFDMQYAERIFRIFQRLNSRSEYEGTGIGLAICRKIVERHGGRIWAVSEGEGKGSSFYFTLKA